MKGGGRALNCSVMEMKENVFLCIYSLSFSVVQSNVHLWVGEKGSRGGEEVEGDSKGGSLV